MVGHQHVGPLELGAVARGVRDEAVVDVAVVEVHALRLFIFSKVMGGSCLVCVPLEEPVVVFNFGWVVGL